MGSSRDSAKASRSSTKTSRPSAKPSGTSRKALKEKISNRKTKKPFKKRSSAKSAGIVKRHPDGFGFFIPDDPLQPDAYISKHHMVGLMSNDRVEAEIYPERHGNRFRGKILGLIQRAIIQIMGPLDEIHGNRAYIRDESHSWGEDLLVSLESLEGAKGVERVGGSGGIGGVKIQTGDWVTVKITSYPQDPKGFQGKLEKIIGDGMNPGNDNLRVLISHQIPLEFSPETMKEVKTFSNEVSESDKKSRVNLKDKAFITIDGQTAKDFDDAIYIQTEKSGFHLWVAIADVSHYVKVNSAIDRDAYDRGTSTYFPNFCHPMLPEVLSNELCSLKPRVDRLVMVAEMTFDFYGNMKSSQFYEAVICSHGRVTYGEAQEVLDGHGPHKLRHVFDVIKQASDLAKVLMKKRFNEGSLQLEIPETEVKVDSAGLVQDILRADRIFAHQLIEELMLAANVAVAQVFSNKKIPTIYRTHGAPDPLLIKKLEVYLQQFGFQKKLSGGKLQKKISLALEEFEGTPQQAILNILTLRAMNQAQYTEENIGHFGLAFKDYTHFTSPIRRYPDLIIHRLLKAICLPQGDRGDSPQGYSPLGKKDIQKAGVWLSACEQRSSYAERRIVSIKKARFMENHIGREFDGFISSVTKFGVFVLLRTFDVDGLVKIEDLPGDRYRFDEKNLSLVGSISGQTYHIGDLMRIQVVAINHEAGKIDFIPC